MLIIGMIGMALGGCSKPTGPEVLIIDSGRYSEAFDAAMDATRDRGMPATLRDRRTGIIETEPCIAGSMVEPWRTDNSGFSQSMENSMAFQRRRARFEFIPAGFTSSPSLDAAGTHPALAGPDVVGIDQPAMDLTTISGELELRVWVYVERAYTPGLRRSTWTRRETRPSKIITPDGEPPLPDSTYWVPVKRDPAYERRLLAEVQEHLAKQDIAVVSGEPVSPPG